MKLLRPRQPAEIGNCLHKRLKQILVKFEKLFGHSQTRNRRAPCVPICENALPLIQPVMIPVPGKRLSCGCVLCVFRQPKWFSGTHIRD